MKSCVGRIRLCDVCKAVLDACDVGQDGIPGKKRKILFQKCFRRFLRRAEDDDPALFEILRICGIDDSHPEGFLFRTLRAVDSDDPVSDFLEPFGKRTSHKAQPDDADGNLAEVTCTHILPFLSA